MFASLRKILSSFSRKIAFASGILIGFSLWWYFTDVAIMIGNYGIQHTSLDVGLSMIMVVCFPLFLMALYHKGMIFGKKETLEKKNIFGTLGGITGTIISGSSCCGLTLASYFGLLPLMNLLPYSGLEIKIIGTLGLLWALRDILIHLETCKVKSK